MSDNPFEETALDPMSTHVVRRSLLVGEDVFLCIENGRDEYVSLSATEALTLYKWLTEHMLMLQQLAKDEQS